MSFRLGLGPVGIELGGALDTGGGIGGSLAFESDILLN